MYSDKFRYWLFSYLEQDSVKQAASSQQAALLQKLLDQCNFCEAEAGLTELKLICASIEKIGLQKTRTIVIRSKNIREDLGASTNKKLKKDKKDKSMALKSGTTGIFDNPAPYSYRIVSGTDTKKFQHDVNLLLKTGEWYLAGGVSVMTVAKVGSLYTQALYKY